MAGLLPSLSSISAPPDQHTIRTFVVGAAVGVAALTATRALRSYSQELRTKEQREALPLRPIEVRSDEVADGVTGLIGTQLASLFTSV